jgi:opacity protein-like surface antigen
MSNSRKHWATLLALLAAPGAASTAERGFYIGAAYSDVSPDYAPPSQIAYPALFATPSRVAGGDLDPIGSRGIKWVAGYRLIDWLAFEADYLDLSGDSRRREVFCVTQPCPDRIRGETASASLSALALWPLGKFDVFARVGVSHWKSTIETVNPDGSLFWSQDLSGTDGKYGAGAQIHIHKVTARLEYERLRFSGDAANTWSIGVAYSFR